MQLMSTYIEWVIIVTIKVGRSVCYSETIRLLTIRQTETNTLA